MTHQNHHRHHAGDSSAELLSNHAFLTQFRNQTLNPVQFNHVGHLRLAWIYLNHHDLDTSLREICTGIKAYAESLGAGSKFHLTITDSLVKIVAKRIDAMEQKDWDLFLEQNSDLVEDAVSVLMQYYSRDVLFSERARTELVVGDIRPI